MLVRYSIVELLMVFEVSAQHEHTIVIHVSCLMLTSPTASALIKVPYTCFVTTHVHIVLLDVIDH